MYEITITQIRLVPFKMNRITKVVSTPEAKDQFISKYISSLHEITSIDLHHRYQLAVRRYKKGLLSVPVFFSHPEKGVLIRNIIEVKSYVY